MKRSYLIDSENINEIWVELLETLGDKDDILVFYTDKSAHMGYDKIIRLMEQKKGTLQWIKCFGGQNALDFQMVTELGYRISQDPKKEYVIVSNDTGYDVVVRYWEQRGCKVRRMRGVECETMADRQQEEEPAIPEGSPVQSQEEPAAAESPSERSGWNDQITGVFQETGSRDAGADMEFLTALCKTVKVSDMSLMHNVLEYQFGQQTGNEIYRILKGNPACRSALASGYISSKRQREKEYLRLVLVRNGMSELDADGILRIINGLPRKNLNAIHTSLVKKFGQEQGGRYYAVLRSHVKIIREL